MTGAAQQARPLHPLGFHVWRDRRGWPIFAQRLREACWILTGKWSLHRAWQSGYDRRSGEAMGEILAQARHVRNYSAPSEVFEAVPVRAIAPEATSVSRPHHRAGDGHEG